MSTQANLGLLIGLAGVVVSAVTGLGLWKQTWKGMVTFVDTSAAKWMLVVAAAAVLLAAGRGLKRRIDEARPTDRGDTDDAIEHASPSLSE